MTFRVRRNADLILLCVFAVVSTLLILLVPVEAVKVVLAVPLALLVPGYAVGVALFAGAQTELAAKLVVACGLSLGTDVLGGMLIDELPGGIDRTNWVSLLLIITLVSSAIALIRRAGGLSAAVGRTGERQPMVSWRVPRVRPASVIVFVIAMIIATGALVESRRHEGAKLVNGYESFSLTAAEHDTSIKLVLTSARQNAASYRVEATIGGRQLTARTVRLAPGARRVYVVQIPPAGVARQFRASALLLDRPGGPFTPRRLSLRIPASH